MKIDFDGLQAFVCVAELSSFVKAAQQLHLTQTALTRRIQKLENLLDARLLDRITRRVELTGTSAQPSHGSHPRHSAPSWHEVMPSWAFSK